MSRSDMIGRERLEALLAGDAPRTSDEAHRVAVLDQLRAATLTAPEALRSRVLEAAPSRRSAFAPRPSRRLVFAVIPAAFALALTAAIVHGLTTKSSSPVATPVVEHGVAPSANQFAAPGAAGGTSSGGSAQAAPKAPADSARSALAPTGGTARLQHTDASLQVRVPDVEHLSSATRAATRIATSLGGYAQSVDYTTPKAGTAPRTSSSACRAECSVRSSGSRVSARSSRRTCRCRICSTRSVSRTRSPAPAAGRGASHGARRSRCRMRSRCCSRSSSPSRSAPSRNVARANGTVAAGKTARISLVLGTGSRGAPPPTESHRPDGALGARLPRLEAMFSSMP